MSLAHTLILIYLLFSAATGKRLHARVPAGTRTQSAIQARQLSRARLMDRAEKLTMTSLFGRADCSLPEPSTMACTCGPEYFLCGGTFCRNLDSDIENCGTCDLECPAGPLTPGCCSGTCVDFADDNSNCGSCDNMCFVMAGEECCGGGCRALESNPEHCGSCFTECDTAGGETCCQGTCRLPSFFEQDDFNCGGCGNDCGPLAICCDSMCIDPEIDENHCGFCGNECDPGDVCRGSLCVTDGG